MAVVGILGQSGGGKKIITGNLTGNGSATIAISVDFAPVNVTVIFNDTYPPVSIAAFAALVGGLGRSLVRNGSGVTSYIDSCTFSYSAGVLSVYSGSPAYTFYSGLQYKYVLTE